MKIQDQQKKDLQKEIQEMEKEFSDLTKRSEVILGKRKTLAENIGVRAQQIGLDMLSDRDTSQASLSLANDKATLSGMDEALSQAEQRLKFLNDEIVYKRKGFVLVDFGALIDEAYSDFMDCVDSMNKTDLKLAVLQAKFVEINKIGATAGANIDQFDHPRILRDMTDYLRGGASSTESLHYKLRNIENTWKETLKIAREKKGG